jgi:hypothetical protein
MTVTKPPSGGSILATIESDAVRSGFADKERAAMRRVALGSRALSSWVRGAALLPGDDEAPRERPGWRQDVVMVAAILAASGAFFGPFHLSDVRTRITLAGIALALLLARAVRSIIEKARYGASLRYDRAMGFFQGAVVRYVAAGFSKVVNANDGLGWLPDGIRGQDKGVTDFQARFHPALNDAQDLVAVILAQPAHTHEQARLQAAALSKSIGRIHAIVADVVSLAHKAEPVDPAVRAKAHHAYRLWQAFLDDYRDIAEQISKQTNARVPLWLGGPLTPPPSLPSFR